MIAYGAVVGVSAGAGGGPVTLSAGIPLGALAVLRCATSGSGGPFNGASDTRSNTWIDATQDNGTRAPWPSHAGFYTELYLSRISTALLAGDQITMAAGPGSTPKLTVVEYFTSVSGSGVPAPYGGTQQQGSPIVTVDPVPAGDLVIGITAHVSAPGSIEPGAPWTALPLQSFSGAGTSVFSSGAWRISTGGGAVTYSPTCVGVSVGGTMLSISIHAPGVNSARGGRSLTMLV